MICWKYQLKTGLQVLEIPQNFEFLSVQNQSGKICLWVSVNPELPKKEVRILTLCTGVEFPKDCLKLGYVDTVQFKKWNPESECEEDYVWHVFWVSGGEIKKEVQA